jgi:hypothetical protein
MAIAKNMIHKKKNIKRNSFLGDEDIFLECKISIEKQLHVPWESFKIYMRNPHNSLSSRENTELGG